MNQLPPQLRPLPTDVRFTVSRDCGDPGCLCSRCLLPIGEKEFPILFFPADGRWEFRYHPKCLGIDTYENEDGWDSDEF